MGGERGILYIRSVAGAALLSGILLSGCVDKTKNSVKQTLEQTSDTLGVSHIGGIEPAQDGTIVIIHGVEVPLDRSPTFVFDVDEIEENPLNMKGIYHTLPSMLGVNQWEDIIRIFNEKETLSDVAIQNFRKANIANLVKDSLIASDLFIPRIHPLLQTIVPASIEDFAIQFPEQLEHLTGEPSLMIVTKYHGQYVRLHYIGGTLYQADYVCPGGPLGHTPEGEFFITNKQKNRKSDKYNNSPMAYAISILESRGVYSHHSNDVNKDPSSHGCIRATAPGAKLAYETTISLMDIINAMNITEKRYFYQGQEVDLDTFNIVLPTDSENIKKEKNRKRGDASYYFSSEDGSGVVYVRTNYDGSQDNFRIYEKHGIVPLVDLEPDFDHAIHGTVVVIFGLY